MLRIPFVRAVVMYLTSPVTLAYFSIIEKTSWGWTVLSSICGPGIMMTMIPRMLGQEVRKVRTEIFLFVTGQGVYLFALFALLKKLIH